MVPRPRPRPRPGLGLEQDHGVGQLRGVRPRPQRVAEPRHLDVEGVQEPADVYLNLSVFVIHSDISGDL